jgi:hypothetical protein
MFSVTIFCEKDFNERDFSFLYIRKKIETYIGFKSLYRYGRFVGNPYLY